MSLKASFLANRRPGLVGAGLSALLGLFLWWSPLGDGLVNLSYDLPFVFGPNTHFEDIVLISMDELSHQRLNQRWGQPWDRSLHARLINYLSDCKARLVVFDVFFAQPSGKTDVDEELALAFKRNGRVVLAGIRDVMSETKLAVEQTFPPQKEFLAVTSNWGIAEVLPDSDRTVRRLYLGTTVNPSLALAAARTAGPTSADRTARFQDIDNSGEAFQGDETNIQEERWINYYGPSASKRIISYCEAFNKPDAFFADKVVFIGGLPKTRFAGEKTDTFRTPLSRFSKHFYPGFDIMATSYLNLVRNDWFARLTDRSELSLILSFGLLFGFGLCLLRPFAGAVVSVFSFLCIAFVAVSAVWQSHVWFAWLIPAGAQLPCAFAWSVIVHNRRLQKEKEQLERTILPESGPKSPSTPVPTPENVAVPASNGMPSPVVLTPQSAEISPPLVPDHTLFRIVGKGSYGEVWLASDAIKTYHAVKVVYRKTFRDAAPFEREFRGMQKFTPISHTHPGWVHVLHVGPNNPVGYFYYVMEIGDDETSGQTISPASYRPKTLRSELAKKGSLPFATCLEMALTLTSALEFLHQNKLIHRDIKPSNVIYVNGAPKLADIGLVTDIGTKGKDVTYVGTEGYIPPEGPGAPPADIYSLGKVLYEASMGLAAARSPDLPTWVMGKSEENTWLLRLNGILVKACERNVEERYQSAANMHAELVLLQFRYQSEKRAAT